MPDLRAVDRATEPTRPFSPNHHAALNLDLYAANPGHGTTIAPPDLSDLPTSALTQCSAPNHCRQAGDTHSHRQLQPSLPDPLSILGK
jgi:hypothetical protein